MKLAVLMEAYPTSTNPYAQMWAHTRNVEYMRKGHQVTVFSFRAGNTYEIDGITVEPANRFSPRELAEKFDLLVVHQPNLRNQLRFLMKLDESVPVIYFIHGHEVLSLELDYPPPYDYMKQSAVNHMLRRIYDVAKLCILNRWFARATSEKTGLVFVSEWMKRMMEQRVGIPVSKYFPTRVIPNSVNRVFLERQYSWQKKKKRDFLCIRQLDYSKYAVDKVVELAFANPDKTFTLYGHGRYFEFHKKPPNLHWENRFLHPSQLPAVFDEHRCAVMPTRLDSQGVMMCEMATYGIPVITSSLDICREMLSGFRNIKFLELDKFDSKVDLEWIVPGDQANRNRFSPDVLIQQELEFFEQMID